MGLLSSEEEGEIAHLYKLMKLRFLESPYISYAILIVIEIWLDEAYFLFLAYEFYGGKFRIGAKADRI